MISMCYIVHRSYTNINTIYSPVCKYRYDSKHSYYFTQAIPLREAFKITYVHTFFHCISECYSFWRLVPFEVGHKGFSFLMRDLETERLNVAWKKTWKDSDCNVGAARGHQGRSSPGILKNTKPISFKFTS